METPSEKFQRRVSAAGAARRKALNKAYLNFNLDKRLAAITRAEKIYNAKVNAARTEFQLAQDTDMALQKMLDGKRLTKREKELVNAELNKRPSAFN